jgi:hypothetical protein
MTEHDIGNLRGRYSRILETSPPGMSLAQRQHRASLPTVTVTLDPDAHHVLSGAASHRRKSIEALCADILLGACFGGSILNLEAKAAAYSAKTEKEKISAQNSANGSHNRGASEIPAEAGEV